jgi:hypothetical protein
MLHRKQLSPEPTVTPPLAGWRHYRPPRKLPGFACARTANIRHANRWGRSSVPFLALSPRPRCGRGRSRGNAGILGDREWRLPLPLPLLALASRARPRRPERSRQRRLHRPMVRSRDEAGDGRRMAGDAGGASPGTRASRVHENGKISRRGAEPQRGRERAENAAG